ncbi:thioesterase II family protein [Streptomyces bambusae]|uniref:Alpha/beta fold hydrolase n=1 Tax=Streptomyces bambusae TaxID=1550616 RepID=A0ABS6Z551_9ACTN|nr:alpha/beta fold hydrolase [Streptomyces bambusae]MBW5482686.1 alpha/beta fold hydrolase [Streptomyces bambusae]
MTTPDEHSDLWIRRYHPAPEQPYRLVVLPHAGGSASFFFPFSRDLAGQAEVLAVQYPGRQDRRGEPALDNVPELVDAIHRALEPWSDKPFALFGHSMGAVLSFELAQRFEAEGAPLTGLIASGRRSPAIHREESVHTRGDDALIAEIRALSGTDAGLLADEELLRMVLPAIRSDYKAIETYRFRPTGSGPALRCPVSVLTGESDPRVGLDEARRWEELTSGEFTFRSFPGGHFYLTPQAAGVTRAVAEDLAAFAAVPAAR